LFFPHFHINEVPLQEVQQRLIAVFKRWGLPGTIKVDNGKPFGDPQRTSVPELVLWLVGLGVKVEWMAPRSPRQNATVERMQRTTAQWAEPAQCTTLEQLQQKLDDLVVVQTSHYGLARAAGQSRQQRYPSLWSNPRRYTKGCFDSKRVDAYLQRTDFVRRVSKNGCFSFYAQSIYVGTAYQNQDLIVRFQPKKRCWYLMAPTGGRLASVAADNFSKAAIERLSVCRKRALKASQLPVANH
jgi:hypothetical protein